MKRGETILMVLGFLFSISAMQVFSAEKTFAAPASVQSFGGTCNGTADDTAALQRWAAAATKNSTLTLSGDCTTTQKIIFPVEDNVSVLGKGAITYRGSDSTVDIVQIGRTNNDCSVTNWFVQDIIIRSSTNMTAGDALKLDDLCSSHFINVDVGRTLNGDGKLFNGIHFNGGNTVHFSGGGASAKNAAMIVNGDRSTQFTDLFLECPTLLGSATGLEIGGNVGGGRNTLR